MARRLNKKQLKSLVASLLLFLILSFLSGYFNVSFSEETKVIPPAPGYYRVTSVWDGDTISIDMDGRDEKVRLIGVDTPETIKPNSPQECYGKEASDFLKGLLSGQDVKVEADPINQNRDRYNRLLRYVYFKEELVNKKIIAEGYGFAYLSFPFTKAEEFRLAQVNARQTSSGVWSGGCQINGPDGERPKTNELT